MNLGSKASLPPLACRGRSTWSAFPPPNSLLVYLLKKKKSPLRKTTRTAKWPLQGQRVVLRDLEGMVAGSKDQDNNNVIAPRVRGQQSLPLTPGWRGGARNLT